MGQPHIHGPRENRGGQIEARFLRDMARMDNPRGWTQSLDATGGPLMRSSEGREWLLPATVVLVVGALGWLVLLGVGAGSLDAQTWMLLLAAAVAAAYAAITWVMARETRHSVALAEKELAAARETVRLVRSQLEAAHAPALVAWPTERVAAGAFSGLGEECICRIVNYGKGSALNIRVLALWAKDEDEEQELCGQNMPFHAPALPRDALDEYPLSNRPRTLPVLGPEQTGEFRASRPPRLAATEWGREQMRAPVLCVRWDDPVARTRRWRCCLVDASPGLSREEIDGARAGSGCDWCTEKIDGRCPHQLGKRQRNGSFATIDPEGSLDGRI